MTNLPIQNVRRALVGRSDLVLAISRNDDDSLHTIAAQLGLLPELARRPQLTINEHPVSGVRLPETAVDRIDTSGYPNDIPPLHQWLMVSYQLQSPLPSQLGGLAYVKWHEQPAQLPEYQFLSPWREVGPRLRRGLIDHRSSKILDLKKLVAQFAKRELTMILPRKKKRRWGRRVLVIKDTSLRLSPFQRDHHEIVERLQKLIPGDCLTVAEGTSPLGLSKCSSGSKTGDGGRLTSNSILPGTQILVLSDLGCLCAFDELWKAWLRWGKKTSEMGCHLVALLPSSDLPVPAILRSLFSIQTWRRPSGITWDNAQRSNLLDQLFVLAAPALRVEPGLLRDLRLLMPERTDASLEVDFWNSELLSSNHPWGATLDFREVNSVLRLQFEQLDQDLRYSVLNRIRHWRLYLNHAPEIWFEELLCLDPDSQAMFPEDLKDAYACFRELDKQRHVSDEDRSYMHRMTQRVSENALANLEIGILVRDAKRDLHPDVTEIAAGTDPREVPPGRLRCYQLDVSDNRLKLQLDDGWQAATNYGGIIVNSSNAIFRIEASRLLSDAEFWKSGKRPDFVSDYGTDRYGPWFEFAVHSGNDQTVVTQRMRWIRPGSFMMGSPLDEPGRFEDELLHEVSITQGFWLADTACTQTMWQAVMDENPSHFIGDDLPVEQVSYVDVVQFCESLSRKIPSLKPQLPTEAQWEYACRAGAQTPFSFGSTITTHQANFDGNYPYADSSKGIYREETVRANDLPANPWGLHQMHGNVWEWCTDWYTETLSAPQTDPKGPDSGSGRVIRGGGWIDDARYVRSACRGRVGPGDRDRRLGFRLLGSAIAEPIEIAEMPVAEQGSELSRIGGAEEIFAIRVDDEKPSELAIQNPTAIRVVSNLEAVEFRRVVKPRWAVEYGRDAFGVYGDFEVASTEGDSAFRQRLRWIPPGSFQMGSPDDEPGRQVNESPHPVTLTSGFWMFDAPCTQRLWKAVMKDNPSFFPDPNRPVEQVDWDQADLFARRLSELLSHDRNSTWANLNFHLPTEAQWEYACRAGTSTAIYSGPLEILGDANAPALNDIAWYGGNSGHEYDLEKSEDVTEYKWLTDKQFPFSRAGTRQVKQKAPNPWGLYDMLGNVWEWCSDWYADNLEGAQTDPKGPESGSNRVVRGGGWIDDARNVRSACRDRVDPGNRDRDLGFRLLSSASPDPGTERESGSRRIPRDEAEENQRTK